MRVICALSLVLVRILAELQILMEACEKKNCSNQVGYQQKHEYGFHSFPISACVRLFQIIASDSVLYFPYSKSNCNGPNTEQMVKHVLVEFYYLIGFNEAVNRTKHPD